MVNIRIGRANDVLQSGFVEFPKEFCATVYGFGTAVENLVIV